MNKITILHIDAHHDLRDSYQGFKHSHASFIKNLIDLDFPPKNIISVGIRDYCEEEYLLAKNCPIIKTFYDKDIKKRLLELESWKYICKDILMNFSEKVYISFDIDGLSPENCPNTGTPVPGGLSYNYVIYLLNRLYKANIDIVGFDLCEVSLGQSENEDWDANVGARILLELSKLVLREKNHQSY